MARNSALEPKTRRRGGGALPRPPRREPGGQPRPAGLHPVLKAVPAATRPRVAAVPFPEAKEKGEGAAQPPLRERTSISSASSRPPVQPRGAGELIKVPPVSS